MLLLGGALAGAGARGVRTGHGRLAWACKDMRERRNGRTAEKLIWRGEKPSQAALEESVKAKLLWRYSGCCKSFSGLHLGQPGGKRGGNALDSLDCMGIHDLLSHPRDRRW